MAENPRSDSELLALAIAGNAEAEDELFARHIRVVHGYTRKLASGNEETASDVLQESVVRVTTQIRMGTLELTSSFGTYWSTVARNLLVDQWRKEKRDRAGSVGALISELAEDGETPSMPVREDEAAQFLHHAIDSLSPRAACIVRHYCLSKMTMNAAASACGCTESQARYAYETAKTELKALCSTQSNVPKI